MGCLRAAVISGQRDASAPRDCRSTSSTSRGAKGVPPDSIVWSTSSRASPRFPSAGPSASARSADGRPASSSTRTRSADNRSDVSTGSRRAWAARDGRISRSSTRRAPAGGLTTCTASLPHASAACSDETTTRTVCSGPRRSSGVRQSAWARPSRATRTMCFTSASQPGDPPVVWSGHDGPVGIVSTSCVRVWDPGTVPDEESRDLREPHRAPSLPP